MHNDRSTARTSVGWTAPLVTLRDGRQVPSDCEAWRFECQARTILSLPTKHDRRVMLAKWQERHGEQERRALEFEILALWEKDQAEKAA